MFKRCVKYLSQLRNRLYSAFIPTERRWAEAQSRYVTWAGAPMDEKYLEYVRRVGSDFSEFVGEPTRLIDVGCGNGVFGGVSYSKAGYIPLKRGNGYILGVDPLPTVYPIPWISAFKQGKIEDMRLSGFNEAAFVTTFDHIADPDTALNNLKLAGVKIIYLWETLYLSHNEGDRDHPHHYTYVELATLLRKYGFKFTRTEKIDGNNTSEGWFIEARTL